MGRRFLEMLMVILASALLAAAVHRIAMAVVK